MRRPVWILIGCLVAYSVVLIAVEMRTSQDFVRNYFTDIEGPVPLYAVNTTISVFLLWTTALLFGVCLVCTEGLPQTARLRWFFASQVAVFAFLGMDDRFKFHELVARRLGIGDHYVLLVVAVAEMLFLAVLGGRAVLERRKLLCLLAAAVLFGVMIVFDALVPHDALLRLTLEDLAKTWAGFCFAAFAWQFCLQRIDLLKSAKLRELTERGTWPAPRA